MRSPMDTQTAAGESAMSADCDGRAAAEVVFASMPYASVERPSVALGTLAAALKREGITARTIHGNLIFAEQIGMADYEGINNSDITSQIGEWTFSEAAFGGTG